MNIRKALLMNVRGGKKFIIQPKQRGEDMRTGIIEGGTAPSQAHAQKNEEQYTIQQRYVPAFRPIAQKYAGFSGIPIPHAKMERPEEREEEDIKLTNIKYPLIPTRPKQGEKVMAYAHIFFDKKTGELIYNVIEPPVTNVKILEEIKTYIQEKLDINFAQIRKNEAASYLNTTFERALAYLKVKVDKNTADVLRYYVVRDFMGLEKVEPIINDKNIEDISCDGVNIPLYVYHKYPQFGSLRTNIKFTDREELDLFVSKLAERSGKNISVARPLLDGTLPDGSRLQATLGSDIARNGSNFTVRMFSEKPLTPVDIINYGTSDLTMMAYLWFLIEHGSSILISGGTASGKTSLLNALSLFIKPQMKIISIEDTSELRLPHPHWVPEVARTPISEEGKVDMYELLRESLRQRPDYVIVGEVRGREAYVLFQQMAVGHPGMSTIHAENFNKLVDRMTSPPISLPSNLLQNLDLILFVKRMKHGRRYNRRIFSATEVVGYDQRSSMPIINETFTWNAKGDSFDNINQSVTIKKISDSTGMSENEIKESIEQRAKVMKWMVQRKINDYKRIASVLSMYYLSPDFLLGRIGDEA